MTSNQERVFYQDTQTQVTSARVVIGSKTYALANISSVDLQYRGNPPSCIPFAGFVPGGILLLAGLLTIASMPVAGLFCLGLGGIITFYCIQAIQKSQPYYAAILETNSGTIDALSAKKKEDLEPVVAAITQAIVERT